MSKRKEKLVTGSLSRAEIEAINKALVWVSSEHVDAEIGMAIVHKLNAKSLSELRAARRKSVAQPAPRPAREKGRRK